MNSLNKINIDNEVLFYFIIYLLSFNLVFLNLDFIYFDDWTLINQSKDDLISIFKSAGVIIFGYVHYYLIEYFGIYFYKILIFIFYFLVGYLLYCILKTIEFINVTSRIIIVSIFLVLPINFARIAIIDFSYAICYLSFFIGFYLFSIIVTKNNFKIRFFSLIFFFFSFIVNSLLVFYIIVFIYALYIFHDKFSKKYIIKFFKYLDFWLLPFIFFIYKSIFLVREGTHVSYYSITKEKLIVSLKSSITIFGRFIVEAYEIILTNTLFILWIFIFIIIFILFEKFKFNISIKETISIKIVFILLGMFFSYIAIYPYMVVNTSPSFFDWDSRHMLLIPLGVSFVLYGLFSLLDNRRYLFLLVISYFIMINNIIYYSMIVDGIKQDSLIYNMKIHKQFKDNNTFVIFDNVEEYDTLKREYRFYEYGGMLDLIYGNQDKYAVLHNQKLSYSTLKKYLITDLKLRNYLIEEKYISVFIEKGSYELSFSNVCILIFNRIFSYNNYEVKLKNIINIRFEKE